MTVAGDSRSLPRAGLGLVLLSRQQGPQWVSCPGSRVEAGVEAPPGQGCQELGLVRRQVQAPRSGQVRSPSSGATVGAAQPAEGRGLHGMPPG